MHIEKSRWQEFTQAQIKRCEGSCQAHMESRPLPMGRGVAEKREGTSLVVGDRTCPAEKAGLGSAHRHENGSRSLGFPGPTDPTISTIQR